MNVVVVGGLDRLRDRYRREIVALGDTAQFINGEDVGERTEAVASTADVAMMITAGMTHKVFNKVRMHVGGAPIVWVNSRSITQFKRALVEMKASMRGGDM